MPARLRCHALLCSVSKTDEASVHPGNKGVSGESGPGLLLILLRWHSQSSPHTLTWAANQGSSSL